MKKTNKIFISIASYRDSELVPTVLDCIKKAKYPKNLHFGIFWQKDETENIDKLNKYKNIKILECKWQDSLGACWSRHKIQKDLYNDETFYLQLDSHHRFIENWDEELTLLINQQKKLGFEKPIIGSYATTYWKNNNTFKNEPYKINTFDSFGDDGDLISRPVFIQNHKKLSNDNIKTIPARLLSGHFIFSDGNFIHECMYDPNYYFRGEELVLSARAYTHGYDFFHPTKTIIWHEYLRINNYKHWEDHKKENGFVITAEDRNVLSKSRQRKLFGMEDNDINFRNYGLGNTRSLHEYELYCGIDFKNKRVHKYCANVRGDSPDPYIMTDDEWNSGMLLPQDFNIEWDLSLIEKLSDYDFWFFGFEDNNGTLLYRNDFKLENPNHLAFLNKENNQINIKFYAEKRPSRCVIIPHSVSNGWMSRVSIPC